MKHTIVGACFLLFLFISNSLADLPPEVEAIKGDLIYENLFEDDSCMDDFTAEGPCIARISNGRLYMESQYPTVNDGHFVYWCKVADHEEDFIIEWEFTPVRDTGLCILFTCARGRNGVDIFDPSLDPRDGQYYQYHSGDIDNYVLSYYRNNADFSGIINLRRNYGHEIVKTVDNPIPEPPTCVDQTYQLVAVKVDGEYTYWVDDTRALEWTDDKPHGSGKFGLRQMATTRAEYDNLRVWKVGDPTAVVHDQKDETTHNPLIHVSQQGERIVYTFKGMKEMKRVSLCDLAGRKVAQLSPDKNGFFSSGGITAGIYLLIGVDSSERRVAGKVVYSGSIISLF